MVRSSSQHRDALSSFEEDHSSTGLQSKIANFQQKQKKQGKEENDYYDWIQTQRKLVKAEEDASKQVFQACANALELLQKEKVDADIIKSLEDDIKVLQQPAADISFTGMVHQSNGPNNEDDEARGRHVHHAKALLDLRENITVSMKELDDQYKILSRDVAEHRREVLQAKYDNKVSKHELPQSLQRALDSLRSLVQSGDNIDCIGEIDVFELELVRALEDAHRGHESILTQVAGQNKAVCPCWDDKSRIIFKKAFCSSKNKSLSTKPLVDRLKIDLPDKTEQDIKQYLGHHKSKKIRKQKVDAAAREMAKKIQMIETNGLKEVERLRKDFEARAQKSKANIEKELKRKEIDIRLKAFRLEQGQVKQAEAVKQQQVLARKVGGEYDKELHRTKRILEAKQVLHQAIDQNENCINELQDRVAVEIQTLKHQQSRKERTAYRQEQMESKLMAQKKAEVEALREEESRLERLNTLAASVPYYKSIMDQSSDINKSTEARKNDVYGGRGELADFQSGKLKSFTEDKIFSDSKFRLSNALHEAGLSNTTYARDVVRNVIPRSEARTTGIKPY